MRPGLVAVGLGLLVVAGAVVAAVFMSSGPGAAGSTHLLRIQLPGGASASATIWGLNGSNVATAIAWRSTGNVTATLTAPHGCTGNATDCTGASHLAVWSTPGVAGAWSSASEGGFPWILDVANPGPGAVTVTVTTSAVRASVAAPSGWAEIAFLAAGASLGAIGAVSLFLGLFLRGGLFPPPRSGGPAAVPPGPPGH